MKYMLQANCYRRWKARDTECPLLIIDGSTHREVEQHRDAPLDFVSVDLLGHLAGPDGLPSEFISRMRPLFTGLDLPEGEIHRHYDSIQSLAIYQLQDFPHLLHSIGIGPLGPPGVAH